MAKKRTDTPADEPVDEALPGTPAVAEAATDVDAGEVAAAEPGDAPAEEPGDSAAEEATESKEEPAARADKIELVTKLDIALGNGTRPRGHRLGVFRCALAVSLPEALALVADPHADSIVNEPLNAGVYPVVTRGAAVVDGREFPPGCHVGNFEIPPQSDTLRSECLFALRNYSVVCS